MPNKPPETDTARRGGGKGNQAPIAVLTASKNQILLPENKVTLSLETSYDPNRKGVIVSYEFFQADTNTPQATFENKTEKTIDVVFDKGGDYTFGGKVTDRGGLTGTASIAISVIQPIVKKTCFGASGPTIDSVEILEKICGKNSVTRTFIGVKDYRGQGSKEADKFLNAGHTVFINLGWARPDRDNQGEKIPVPFPKDMTLYRSQLEKIFVDLAKSPHKDKIISVCENEPTNIHMHSGPMSDYLKMLEVFIDVAKKYSIRAIDGGVHVATVMGADSIEGEGTGSLAEQLLSGYAKLPGLYAVNLHTSNVNKDHYQSDTIVQSVKKIKELTGYDTISNEWHVQYTDNANMITEVCKGWSDAGVEYSVYITGTNPGKDCDLNDGLNLTPFGTVYKETIESSR